MVKCATPAKLAPERVEADAEAELDVPATVILEVDMPEVEAVKNWRATPLRLFRLSAFLNSGTAVRPLCDQSS